MAMDISVSSVKSAKAQELPGQRRMWLAEREVSEITGLSLSKLRQDRHKRQGIIYSKIGRSVRYELKDVEAFMQSYRVNLLR
jgi:predicted DNA-binding transcriptional regulator AlpA